MNLSHSFTLDELTASQTATRNGIDNTPNPQQIEALKKLCENILEPLQQRLTISISSGFRCVELNKAIGGAGSSQHCLGEASDISAKEMNVEQLYQYIKHSGLPYDQLLQEYDRWVHVSYSSRNRRQCLRAVKENGKTVYKPD